MIQTTSAYQVNVVTEQRKARCISIAELSNTDKSVESAKLIAQRVIDYACKTAFKRIATQQARAKENKLQRAVVKANDARITQLQAILAQRSSVSAVN